MEIHQSKRVSCVYEFANGGGGGVDPREYSGGHIHTHADERVGLTPLEPKSRLGTNYSKFELCVPTTGLRFKKG